MLERERVFNERLHVARRLIEARGGAAIELARRGGEVMLLGSLIARERCFSSRRRHLALIVSLFYVYVCVYVYLCSSLREREGERWLLRQAVQCGPLDTLVTQAAAAAVVAAIVGDFSRIASPRWE